MTFGVITTKKPAQIEWAFLLYGVSFITYERGQGLASFCECLFNLKDDISLMAQHSFFTESRILSVAPH